METKLTPADLLQALAHPGVQDAKVRGVYYITNRVSKKNYVGSSQNIHTRLLAHFSQLLRGSHANIHLQRSFNKHGHSSFIWGICEVVADDADLLAVEQTYIDSMGDMNISRVAGSTTGYKPTEETRAKLRARSSGTNNPMYGRKRPEVGERSRLQFTGRKLTEEHKAKMSAGLRGSRSFWDDHIKKAEVCKKIGDANRGRVLTDEHKAKISAAGKGRKKSAEHREKIGQANRGRVVSEETRKLISEAHMGKKMNLSDEERARRSERARAMAKSRTPEQIAAQVEKAAATRRGKPLSQEQKDKMSAALKGRKFSADHLAALKKAGEIRAANKN